MLSPLSPALTHETTSLCPLSLSLSLSLSHLLPLSLSIYLSLPLSRLRYRRTAGHLTAADKARDEKQGTENQHTSKHLSLRENERARPHGEVLQALAKLQSQFKVIQRSSSSNQAMMESAVKKLAARRKAESSSKLKRVVSSLMREHSIGGDSGIVATPRSPDSPPGTSVAEKSPSPTKGGEGAPASPGTSGAITASDAVGIAARVDRLEEKLDGVLAAIAAQSDMLRQFANHHTSGTVIDDESDESSY